MKIALIGFGVVGQGFAKILQDTQQRLRGKHQFESTIVAVATRSRGTLYNPDGLSLSNLLDSIQQGSLKSYPDGSNLQRDWDVAKIISESNADVVVEVSPSNFEDAQPALDYIRLALENGKHVVTANKGPIALAYSELEQKAQDVNKQLLFEGTVMAGTPSLQMSMGSLAGCEILEARGILNGTTNYILTQMESGMEYADALKQAQELGYAETDPTADVEGWDAAGKVLILSAVLFGKTITMDDVDVQGITQITSADIQAAKQAGERWKLIATATPTGGSVQPMRLPITDPLAGVGGATNALTLDTDLMGEVTIIGAGAGKIETGYAILSDLFVIQRYNRII